MKNHEQITQDRHQIGGVNVGDVNHQNHGEHEQSPLPVFGFIVRIPHTDQALDDSSRQERP